jgi:co-chaperonin GroES (HSP10)
MKIKPTGYSIVVEVAPVDVCIDGGVIERLPDEIAREEKGRDLGRVISFGPIAFLGFGGCKTPEDWGVKVGDLVEFNRYDGKIPRISEEHPEFRTFRIIQDKDIIAVIEE